MEYMDGGKNHVPTWQKQDGDFERWRIKRHEEIRIWPKV